MAVQTINLPAGTNVTKHLALPKCGAWVGAMAVSLTTFGVDATVHSWLFYYPDAGDNKIRVRRTGGSTLVNFQNWTLFKNQRLGRGLYKGESLTTINYTATNEISLCVETTRSLVPDDYPPLPSLSGQANEIPIANYLVAGKVHWLPS